MRSPENREPFVVIILKIPYALLERTPHSPSTTRSYEAGSGAHSIRRGQILFGRGGFQTRPRAAMSTHEISGSSARRCRDHFISITRLSQQANTRAGLKERRRRIQAAAMAGASVSFAI